MSTNAGALQLLLVLTLGAPAARSQDWKALERQLHSHDEDERTAAIVDLARIGGARALSILVAALEDPKTYNRDLACARIAAIADAETIRTVIFPARSSLNALGRQAWAELLAAYRAPFPLPKALKTLGDEKTREVTLLALRDVLIAAEQPLTGRRPVGLSRRAWEAELARRRVGRAVVAGIETKSWAGTLRSLLRDKDRHVRAALIQVCAHGPRALAADLLGRFQRDDPGLRCVLLDAWSHVDPSRAREMSCAALRELSWRLRVQAAEVLARIGDESSVAALVDALARQRDDSPARFRLGWALEELTGMRLGIRGADWQRWWRDHREGYRLPARRSREHAQASAARTTVSYHGLPVTSKRVIFVIDNSGSMRDPLGSAGADQRAAATKKDSALAELARVVAALPDDARVNVVLFATRAQSWKRGLTPLKGRARKALLAWARNIEPKGWTNLLGGILLALDDPQVEEIYVLSDGAPSAGEHIFAAEVRRRIRDRNRLAKVRIHTVAFLSTAPDPAGQKRLARHRKLLAGIATESGGEAALVQR